MERFYSFGNELMHISQKVLDLFVFQSYDIIFTIILLNSEITMPTQHLFNPLTTTLKIMYLVGNSTVLHIRKCIKIILIYA